MGNILTMDIIGSSRPMKMGGSLSPLFVHDASPQASETKGLGRSVWTAGLDLYLIAEPMGHKRKSERDREEDDDARRLRFDDKALKAKAAPNAEGDLRYRGERDSEVRDLWLGDLDPTDIEKDSTAKQIDGFRFIDPEG